jgi:hypothetical protein
MTAPRLSVVMACAPGRHVRDATADARSAVEALARSCAGIDAELLLVGLGDDAPLGTLGSPPRSVGRIPASAAALVPRRWALGLAAARGDVVAFTTDLCRVDAGWARAALDAIAGGAAAVGGPLHPATALSPTDRAIFHLRFGALAATTDAIAEVHDVAADNAAYDRRALMALGTSFDEGFWEVEANRRLRADGRRLVFHGGMIAAYVGGEALGSLTAQRFAHGRHAGAWRVAIGVRRWWHVVLASPLVPLVLLDRARRRRAGAGRLPSLAEASPAFLLLASAWAAGEAMGALAAWRGRAPFRT